LGWNFTFVRSMFDAHACEASREFIKADVLSPLRLRFAKFSAKISSPNHHDQVQKVVSLFRCAFHGGDSEDKPKNKVTNVTIIVVRHWVYRQ
jgi:hypothetical protein